jgi:3',5'-cyclic AMP phosphodiesterase CpdA
MSKIGKSLAFFILSFCLLFPFVLGSEDYSSFGIIGDTSIGKDETVFLKFLGHLKKLGVKTFFHTGDVIHNPGSEKEWDRFLELTKDQFEFHIAPGNHDINSPRSLKIYKEKIKRPPYYSLESGDTLFLLLCTEMPGEEGRIGPKQLHWLKEELKKDHPFKFVFLHRSLFPTIFGRSFCLDRFPKERDALHRTFVENRVLCVFSGHEHIYSRISKEGLKYVTTGGGGSELLVGLEEYGGFHHYTLAKKAEDRYIFSVFDLNGRIKDQFMIKR